ncbi:MAG: 50S ribosomal protein L23 [Nitrososphaerales archaeon]
MKVEDALKIIKRPYVTEKTLALVEKENKLVFLVNEEASKKEIKRAIKTLYGVEVSTVNTARTLYGKKAYVRLSPKYSANDLASKLGLA